MHEKIDPELLVDWEQRKSYTPEELGIEPDLWDYVKKDGTLTTLENLEDTCARAFDNANKPNTIFGKTYTASEIAREIAWNDWNNYIEDSLSTMRAEGTIRRIN